MNYKLNSETLHNTALRIRNKIDDLISFDGRCKFGFDDIKRFGHIVFFEEYDTVNLLYLVDGTCRIASAAQTNRIDTNIRQWLATGFGIRRNILANKRAARNHAVCANLNKLVHGRSTAYKGIVIHINMPG